MTQAEIIETGYKESKGGGYFPSHHDFVQGAKFAFSYALAEFKELLDAHFGTDSEYEDERLDMLNCFEERLGL